MVGRRRRLGLHADHLDRRAHRLGHHAGTGRPAATTDRDHDISAGAAGLAIGVTYALGIFVAMPFTTGALNPARALGPWLATGTHIANQGVYWVGPLAGGFLAGLLYDSIYLTKKLAD